jgi:LysR family glycine cleavage system transcriptional activator
MRRYDLPPLDLLEAFEAAGRQLSFTRAADELALTQSAVSRQIQALEERLGTPLFQRLHRALRLTDAGERLLHTTTEVLNQLQGVTAQLRPGQRQRSVVVTTTPGLAGLWLIPRLAGFTAQRPDVDVRISAGNALVNLEREGVDLALRYCTRQRAGPGARKLFDEVVTPVCSPALVRDARRPLRRPADLKHHLLLHLDAQSSGHLLEWAPWLRTMKVADLRPAGELHFSLYDQLIQAAVQGQGVALGRLPMVAGLIAEGRLVAPFRRALASPLGYFLIRSANAGARAEVDAFADWLLATAAAADSSGPADRAPA